MLKKKKLKVPNSRLWCLQNAGTICFCVCYRCVCVSVCASMCVCVCFCEEKQCKLTWVGPSCGGFPEHNLLVHGWNLHVDTVLQASGLPLPPPNFFCWGLVDIGRRGSRSSPYR